MRILSFSPHNYFPVHSYPEGLFLDNLVQQGHEVLTVNCNGVLKGFCLCFFNTTISQKDIHRRRCLTCKRIRDDVNKEFKLRSIYLDTYLEAKDYRDTENILININVSNIHDFLIDDIPIGKYSGYEFNLNHKLNSGNIPEHLWTERREILRNSILTHKAIHKIYNSFKPDRTVAYNSLYSVNRVVCAVSELQKIPHFSIHAGNNLDTRLQQLMVYKGYGYVVNNRDFVTLSRNKPCTSEQLKSVRKHIFELFAAKSPWVYTQKSRNLSTSSLRKTLNITLKQKVLLAVMRSNDERKAAEDSGFIFHDSTPIFKDQIEWCNFLINYAFKNPNNFIIFRVHPREFPNKREGVTSQFAKEFLKFIKKSTIPSNFYFNLPVDKISVHDLYKITDLVLNNSSTVGLEASLLGIPVIGCGDVLYSFDPALQKEPRSMDDYSRMISREVEVGLCAKRIIIAFRWLRYFSEHVCIDISDGYKVTNKSRINKVLIKFRSLLSRFGLSIEALSSLEVLSRNKPLENSKWLAYTVINDVEDHIDYRNLEYSNDSKAEKNLIQECFLQYANAICSKDDYVYKKQISIIASQFSNSIEP